MRVVAGIALIAQGLMGLRTGTATEAAILALLAIAAGILLLAGLWTPIAGSLAAVLQLWNVISQLRDPLADILLGTLCLALVMIGPGAWSVDARLFGWKRIDLPDRQN